MPKYGRKLSEQDVKEAAVGSADYTPYLDVVQAALREPESAAYAFELTAEEVKDRRSHKRRFKTAADLLGYTLVWLNVNPAKVLEDELWARLYKKGEEPVRRPRRKREPAE